MPAIKESRYALRLLRPGYVHVYIASPPPGVKNWLGYRVTAEADLVPEAHALFKQPDAPVGCARPEHIATGMKLLTIPQAHKIPEIWVAFSGNLWNATLRDRNKADPAVMQKISLQAGGSNTFVPTADKLRAQVLECSLGDLTIGKTKNPDLPFTSLAACVDDVVSNMSSAAAKHPKTAGKERAIVLADPVGVAMELNAIRIARNEFITEETEKPKIKHALMSSNAILGLKMCVIDEKDWSSYEEVCPFRTKEAFDKSKWPAGTTWHPLSEADRAMQLRRAKRDSAWASAILAPYRTAFSDPNVGRVIYPDHEERSAAWTKKKVDKYWSSLERYYDEKARADWMTSFESRMQAEHYRPLELIEKDWNIACRDDRVAVYFEKHFDQETRDDERQLPVPSLVKSHEVSKISQPASFVDGPVMDDYVKVLSMSPKDRRAYILRAFVGNKKETIAALDAQMASNRYDIKMPDPTSKVLADQLTGDPGSVGMRDKSFDLLKGVSELDALKSVMGQKAWIGNALAAFSVGHLQALAAAVATVAARHATNSATVATLTGHIMNLSLVQSTLDAMVQGALTGAAPKVAVIVRMRVDADTALAILKARPGEDLGTSRSRIKQYRNTNTRVTLAVLTDTDAIKAAGGDLERVAKNPGAGTVRMGNAASAAIAGSSAHVLTDRRLVQLYGQQATRIANAANSVRSAMSSFTNSTFGSTTVAMSTSLNARLALASMVVQFIGIQQGKASVAASRDESTRIDNEYLVMDSYAGITAGAFALAAVASEITVARKHGADGVKLSKTVSALRIAGNFAGLASGIINYKAAAKKSRDQAANGNVMSARLYRVSAITFFGTGATSGALIAVEIAEALVVRSMGGALARSLAARTVLTTVAGTVITISGLGLVLLGVSMATYIGAVALTPNALQRWLGRSYFGLDGGVWGTGKRKDKFEDGRWDLEQAELDKLLAESAKSQS